MCLFVHSSLTAPAGLPELHRWGLDIVVVWDADDPATDVRLRAERRTGELLKDLARTPPTESGAMKAIQRWEKITRRPFLLTIE